MIKTKSLKDEVFKKFAEIGYKTNIPIVGRVGEGVTGLLSTNRICRFPRVREGARCLDVVEDVEYGK